MERPHDSVHDYEVEDGERGYCAPCVSVFVLGWFDEQDEYASEDD